MSGKTFAYQLGEMRGTKFARDWAVAGGDGTLNVQHNADVLGAGVYLTSDPQHGEYVEGFHAAWARWFSLPEFLWAAPVEPPVVATQPALRAALEAALPDAKQLGFHDQLATFLIEHMTCMPDTNTGR